MNGNKLIIQYGLESTFGTIGTATKQIQVASEGFKLNLNKKDEGLLTGSKIGGKKVTVSRKGEGALSTLARPDDIGLFLACALGNESSSLVEGSTGAYAHTFTLTDNDILDSLFFKVKRDASIIKGYTGVSYDGFSLDSQTEDFMKLDLTLLGKDEVNTTLESGLSLSPLSPFRLASSVIKIDDEAIEVLSNKFDFKNGLSASQTNLSGMYFKQPMVGVREITNEVSVFYNSAIESILDLYMMSPSVNTQS